MIFGATAGSYPEINGWMNDIMVRVRRRASQKIELFLLKKVWNTDFQYEYLGPAMRSDWSTSKVANANLSAVFAISYLASFFTAKLIRGSTKVTRISPRKIASIEITVKIKVSAIIIALL